MSEGAKSVFLWWWIHTGALGSAVLGQGRKSGHAAKTGAKTQGEERFLVPLSASACLLRGHPCREAGLQQGDADPHP